MKPEYKGFAMKYHMKTCTRFYFYGYILYITILIICRFLESDLFKSANVRILTRVC